MKIKTAMLLAFTLAASTTASAKDMFYALSGDFCNVNRADKDPT
jgi:hypothetical protein